MFKPFKGFNSKGFLLLYLVVIVIMLTAWLSRLEFSQPDTRNIPASLKPFLLSPARELPQFLLYDNEKQVLTNQSFKQHWSFVYFSHPQCQPQCEAILEVLDNLKRYFAAADMQFLMINFDASLQTDLSPAPVHRVSSLPLYYGEQATIDQLIHAFGFLYLRTEFETGYQLEQQHDIYLLDPKGRVYARFEPPFTSMLLQQRFFAIRSFYARTE